MQEFCFGCRNNVALNEKTGTATVTSRESSASPFPGYGTEAKLTPDNFSNGAIPQICRFEGVNCKCRLKLTAWRQAHQPAS